MKKILAIWAAIALPLGLVFLAVRWANHPNLAAFFLHPGLSFFLVFVFALYLIRRFLLVKPGLYVRGFGIWLAVRYFTQCFSTNNVPSQNDLALAAWSFYAALAGASLFFLGMEEFEGLALKVLKRKKLPAFLGAVLLGLLAALVFGGANASGYGLSSRILFLLAGGFCVLGALIRAYILKADPEYLTGFVWLYLALKLNTLYSPGFVPSIHFPMNWLFNAHIFFSFLVYVFWEKLLQPKSKARIFIGAFAVAGFLFTFFLQSTLWTCQILIVAGLLMWNLGWDKKTAQLPWVVKARAWAQKILANPKLKMLVDKSGKKAASLGGLLAAWSKKPVVKWSAAGLAGLVVLALLGNLVYQMLSTYVISFTPAGTLTSASTVIRVKFSNDITVAGTLDSAFQITPPLPGTTRLEDSKTLVYTPGAPLLPATTYRVRLDTSELRAKSLFLQGSAKTVFATEPFQVVSNRLFYTYDLVKGTEKELVGELEFNYPVELQRLNQALSVTRGNQSLAFSLEPGTLPTRFFFKAGGLTRDFDPQVLTVKISGDLSCVDCGNSLAKPFQTTLVLPARPKMRVNQVQLHHEPGNTLISILFTLPASAAEVKNNVTITPAVPFTVQTEYCYAVLRADFQPNVSYQVKISKGLRAQSGEILDNDYSQALQLQDVQPYVRFADPGRLIPLAGGKRVAVKTMNLDAYSVRVVKVFRNNLVDFLKRVHTYSNEDYNGGESYSYVEGDTDSIGSQVWSGNVTVEGGQINQEVETDLDFSKWQSAPYKGLFAVYLNGSDGGGQDARWFAATDLGLLTKRSGNDLWVQAISISTLAPAAGAHLQLLSDNNQVIAEADTDLDGRAWFKDINNNPYKFTPFVVVASLGDDWSFLSLNDSPLDQSRFDIGGDPFSTEGWDSFVTSDRGLYRPGDTAHFTAIVRHADLKTPEALPVNLVVTDAAGNPVSKLVSKLQKGGLTTFDLPVPLDLSTGTLNAALQLENGVQLGSTSIKVEEFIPAKIKVQVSSPQKTANAGEQLSFQVQARYLFGAPAANLQVQSVVHLSAQPFTSKDWASYQFSDSSRVFDGEDLQVPNGLTDDSGNQTVQLPVPISMLPPSMMKAVVYTEVLDNGGRAVGANAVINVHRYPYYLGLKALPGKEVGPGTKVRMKYVAITPDGKPTTVTQVNLIVKRKVWYSIFRDSGWSGSGTESSYYEEVILGKQVDIHGKGGFTFTPDKPGEYTVYLGNEDSMRSALTVVVSGPGGAPAANTSSDLELPGRLSLILNQPSYAVGAVPRVEVRAPFAGRLILTLEREKVFYTKSLEVPSGLSVVSLPPTDENDLPNAYVVGLLVRKPDESMRRLPMASFGVVPLNLDASTRQIDLKWTTADSVKSKDGIDVRLDTGHPGSQVVLSAVDEGILQIVSFATPDPFKYFYRKRGMTTSTYSLFDQVLPNLGQKLAVGGDEGEGFKARNLNPVAAKRVKSFAQFTGILTADETGTITYHFPTKEFHGEVRLMALAVDGDKFGGSSFKVQVADPVVVEPSFPRFLAPGDNFDVPVLVYNHAKQAESVAVKLSQTGPVAVDGGDQQSVELEPGDQKQLIFHAKALMAAGVADFKVSATDQNDQTYDVDTELSVRPGNPLTTEIKYGQLNAQDKVKLPVPGGFIPQGQRVRLAVSSSPLLTFLGSLDYLINYPYGCAEQMTSQAFPLLYFKDMGLLTGRFEDRANAVDMFIQAAVDNLCKQQLEDGTFALWAGENESGGDYLSNYVSHFLLEANRLGYNVPQDALDKVTQRLGAINVQGQGDRLDRRQQNVELPDSAYILYLRTLAGKPDLQSMAAFRDDLKNRSLTDRCFLSLAYSKIGDRATAAALLPPHYTPTSLERALGGDWFSPNRERAIYLYALAEASPQSPEIPVLIQAFGQALKDGAFHSTQEDAWAFMAIGQAVKASTQAEPLTGAWSIPGGTAHALAGDNASVKDTALSGKEVTLSNLGDQPFYYNLMGEGTRLEQEKGSVANGLSVVREYRDEKGGLVNLGSVTQGELVVVTLRIHCAKPLDNLVVVDLLPAGLEVDNPRLSSRGSLGFDPECSFQPVSEDFRDDRVLLFSKDVDGDLSFSYSVRAVTPGRFQVPGVSAEAMYDPDIFGRSGPGDELIVAPFKF